MNFSKHHPPVGKRRSLLTHCTMEMLGMFLAFNFDHNLEAGTPVSPVLPLMILSLRCKNLCGILGGGGTAELLVELGPPWGGVCGRGYFTPGTSPPQSLEHPGLSCLWSSHEGFTLRRTLSPHASTALPWELSPDPENFLILQPSQRVTRALGSARGPGSTSLADRGLWAP